MGSPIKILGQNVVLKQKWRENGVPKQIGGKMSSHNYPKISMIDYRGFWWREGGLIPLARITASRTYLYLV